MGSGDGTTIFTSETGHLQSRRDTQKHAVLEVTLQQYIPSAIAMYTVVCLHLAWLLLSVICIWHGKARTA